MRFLTVNAGSTSLKLAVVDDGVVVDTPRSLDAALTGPPPYAIAHRVVHGGDRTASVLVDNAVLDELRALTALAPLHQPPALDALERCRAAWPGVPQVACFDTAFHATIPRPARTYALPERLRAKVRVYGFHGVSHAWSVGRVRELAPEARRVVVAHLGGGQSLCAARNGQSVFTTMGFTPLDGLVMATRSGTIDPGALLWLAEHTTEDLGRVLETESGLLGLSGTGDMRELLERVDAGDEAAQFAFEVWTDRATAELGAAIAVLGGCDALVFTGGIGERAPQVRATLTGALGWLGVDAAEDRGGEGDREISGLTSSARVFVVEAREDLQMASEAASTLTVR
jgi:acetate kinase